MNCVKDNTVFYSLPKSTAVGVIMSILFFSNIAIADYNGDEKKAKTKDSLLFDKNGFKSLFLTSSFDPAKPYVSQLNPRAVPFVQDYIRTSGARLEKMKLWGKPYFDMYDGILTKHGLPKELKYLSVIESDLIAGAVSWAGAVGPWQIMAEEARRMGLRITGRTDERTNFHKSTHAAAKILKGLYREFNDWTLVIAAYNCGAGRVRQAIRKSGSTDFWDLQAYLPLETRNHVKRFIGTHYIFEGSGGLTTMTASEVLDFDDKLKESTYKKTSLRDVDDSTGTLEITGKYKGAIVAKSLSIDLAAFNKMNPKFDKVVSAGKSYNLKLPPGKISVFSLNKHSILEECIASFLNY
jgi:membrane-bound lytic murein transglycosylase D